MKSMNKTKPLELFSNMRILKCQERADILYVNYFNDFHGWQKELILDYCDVSYVSAEVENSSWYIRRKVAQKGTDTDRWNLTNDISANVRVAVVTYGTEAMRQAMKDDDSKMVRAAIYRHTTDEDLRDHVASGRKWSPSFIRTVKNNATNSKHIAKAKLLNR